MEEELYTECSLDICLFFELALQTIFFGTK